MRNTVHFCDAKLLLSFVFALLLSSYAYSSVEKSIYGYRINISDVKLLTETYEQLSVTLNATNTGRADLHLGDESITPEMVIFIFDEEFQRGELRGYRKEIQSQLLQQKIKLRKGKISKDIQFYIPKSKDLAKKVTYQTYEPNIFNKPTISLNKNSKNTKKNKQDDVAKANTKQSKTPSSAKVKSKQKDTKIASTPSKPKKSKSSIKKDNSISTPSKSTNTSMASNSKASVPETAPSNNSYTSKPVVKTQKENVQAAKASNMESQVATIDTSIDKEVKKEKERSKLLKIRKEKVPQANTVKEKEVIEGTGFSTAAGINASKNSYKDKEKCPDFLIENITIISQSSKWLELEYTIVNKGLGPANLYGESDGDSDNLALKAYLASSEKLSRGSLPLGGGLVKKNKELKKGILDVDQSYTGTMKLDIRKMTRFTPYVILSLNPFNTINECDKTNNKNHILIEKK